MASERSSTPPAFIEAKYSARFVRFFAWWVRKKMLAKKFAAVRIASGTERHLADLAAHDGPVLCCANHVGWWDPLVMLALHREFLRERTIRAPMDAAQLARFGFFRKLGTFGIDPDNPESLRLMGESVGRYFTEDRSPTFWITPQGRFADVREDVVIRPGAAAMAARHPTTRVVSVAIEYPFLVDPRPEVWIRLAPIEPEPGPDGVLNTPRWHRAIERTMRENQSALAGLVVARDPEAMTDIIGGSASHGNPFYDLFLRLIGRSGRIDDRRDRGVPAENARSAAS